MPQTAFHPQVRPTLNLVGSHPARASQGRSVSRKGSLGVWAPYLALQHMKKVMLLDQQGVSSHGLEESRHQLQGIEIGIRSDRVG